MDNLLASSKQILSSGWAIALISISIYFIHYHFTLAMIPINRYHIYNMMGWTLGHQNPSKWMILVDVINGRIGFICSLIAPCGIGLFFVITTLSFILSYFGGVVRTLISFCTNVWRFRKNKYWTGDY